MIRKLADLDMFVQIQSEHDQLRCSVPWIETIPVKVLIDHLGRPTPSAGLGQPGFKALLNLAKTKRVSVKLSGYSKYSTRQLPVRGLLALRARRGRSFYPPTLSVGVRLALFARSGTAGLRAAGRVDRGFISERWRPPRVAAGHATAAAWLRLNGEMTAGILFSEGFGIIVAMPHF